ncbi:Tlg2-vesicle protein, partial [Cryomyces antarcticus]
MIRLCPLPYSLSNGAIATFPTVHWLSFMLATAIASPKLLLHVFVGSRLGAIAKSGDKMDAKTKAISYLSIVIGLIAGVATGWIMYRKTTARAQELEAEEAETTRRSSSDDVEAEYSDDSEEREAVAALRNSGDDISLHRNETDNNAYADTFSEDEDVQDVFELGDGDEEEGFA